VIVSLRGVLAAADADRVVLESGGLGYGVLVPGRLASSLSRRVGDEIFLHTYLHVRDDALQLFGFESPRERRFFVTLIGVSGVGPKVALAILSAYSVADLETAVVRGDDKRFESIPGIGRKLAQRLVIELKDKVGVELEPVPASMSSDGGAAGADPFLQARVALQNLGLPLREAEAALQGAPEGADLEELVRYALTKKSTSRTP
jgi:Holliday junction DNA helicase RuvA